MGAVEVGAEEEGATAALLTEYARMRLKILLKTGICRASATGGASFFLALFRDHIDDRQRLLA